MITTDSLNALKKCFLAVQFFKVESLNNLIDSAKLNRLKERQKNIYALIDFINIDPDLFEKTAHTLKKEYETPFPTSMSLLETLALENAQFIFSHYFKDYVEKELHIEKILTPLHNIVTFFENENNLGYPAVKSLTDLARTEEQKIEHVLKKRIVDATIAIENIDTFKTLSKIEIDLIYTNLNYFINHLHQDIYLKRVFNSLAEEKNIDSLLLTTNFMCLNDFLHGYLLIQHSFTESLYQNEKKESFKNGLQCLKNANQNLLDPEVLLYFNKTRQEILHHAQELEVYDLFGKRRVNFLKSGQRRKTSPQ